MATALPPKPLSSFNPRSDVILNDSQDEVEKEPQREQKDLIQIFTEHLEEPTIFIKNPGFAANTSLLLIRENIALGNTQAVNKIVRQFQIHRLSKLTEIEESVVIRGSEGKIHINKELLASSCDYFKAMFSFSWRETELKDGQQIITFPNQSLASLKALKKGIYAGVWKEITSKEIQSIEAIIEFTQFADIINIPDWYAHCKKNIKSLLCHYIPSNLTETRKIIDYTNLFFSSYKDPELLAPFFKVIEKSPYCPYKMKYMEPALLISSDKLELFEERKKILDSKNEPLKAVQNIFQSIFNDMKDLFFSPKPQFDEEVAASLDELITGFYIDNETKANTIGTTLSAISDTKRKQIEFVRIDAHIAPEKILSLVDTLFTYCPNLKGLALPFPGNLARVYDDTGTTLKNFSYESELPMKNVTTFVTKYNPGEFNPFGKQAISNYDYEDTYYIMLLQRLQREKNFNYLRILPPPDDDCFQMIKLSKASKDLNQALSKIKLIFELNSSS